MGADDQLERERAVTLDDPAAIARGDAHRTREVLAAFPAQCREAVGLRPEPGGPFVRRRAVIVAGMGGSAAGADLLAACAAERLDVPVLVHRGYGLPALVGQRDLVIVVSYSGDTAETLSAAEAALERGSSVVAVTAGGRLGALAAQRNLPRVALPTGLMPRMALGYLFFPLLAILKSADLTVVKDSEVDEALVALDAQAGALGPGRPAAENEAKRLALALGSRLPGIYGGAPPRAPAPPRENRPPGKTQTLLAGRPPPPSEHTQNAAWERA